MNEPDDQTEIEEAPRTRDPKEWAENFAQACVRGMATQGQDKATLNLACEHLELRSRLETLESVWGFRLPVVAMIAVFGLSAVLASVGVGIAIERLAQCHEACESTDESVETDAQ